MDKAIKKENVFFEKARAIVTSLFQGKQEDTISTEKKQLLEDIEEALADLRYARSCFADAKDPEMIEACVYEIKSAEARYSFLLRKAKRMANNDPKVSI